MSSEETIFEVTNSIKKFLSKNINNLTEEKIIFESPAQKIDDKSLSIFLLNIEENPHLKNRFDHDFPRGSAGNSDVKISYPSLPLDLHYLLTPIEAEIAKNQILLAKILKTFHENPILKGDDLTETLIDGGTKEIKIILKRLSFEEINNIWNLLGSDKFYKIGLHYLISPVLIPSTITRQEKTA